MNEEKENKYCCDEFTKTILNPDDAYDRATTFTFVKGTWFTDFSDGEYGDIVLTFCPFCGSKLEKPNSLIKYGWSYEK